MDEVSHIIAFIPFEPRVAVNLAIVAVLLFMSAMMSGSETSLFSLSPSDINDIRKHGGRANEAVMRLLSQQDYLLATVLIANNLVNICVVILSNNTIDLTMVFGSAVWAFVIKTVIVTFLLLLFGEIMPKIFATYNPLRLARRVAVPLLGIRWLLRPFSWILISSSNRISGTVARKRVNISMDELSDAIEITGSQSEEERQMLSGIVGFVNRDVEQIMKPRIDIVAIDLTADFDTVRRTIIESGFSRIPVCGESMDNIVGILYVRDMLPFIAESAGFRWTEHLRQPYFVPEHKKISDLLEEFQAGKVHMAIVVDEYGSTLGLVSLEDILEEIVGEISDESDMDTPTFYTVVDDSTYIFEGKTHINDLVRVLGVGGDFFDEVKGDAETLAGLMLELRHDFLRKGESVSSRGIKMTVRSLEGRRIDKVEVVVKK